MNEQKLRETEARLVVAAMVSADVARELVAEVRRLQAEYEHAALQALRAGDVLRKVEWSGTWQALEICPVCTRSKDQGHSDDCALAALWKDGEGVA